MRTWLVLAVLAFMVVAAPRRRDAIVTGSWRSVRRQCEQGPCGHLPVEEADNCVLECQAPSCFAAVYGAEPLEPGEVDTVRAARFATCLRGLEQQLRGANLWPPRLDGFTGYLVEPPTPGGSA